MVDDQISYRPLICSRCVATSAQVKDLLKGGRQDQRARSFVTILTDFYLLLVSDSTKKWKVHNSTLAESLHSVLYTMIEHGQNSKDNWTNLTVAAQKLKVSQLQSFCTDCRINITILIFRL